MCVRLLIVCALGVLSACATAPATLDMSTLQRSAEALLDDLHEAASEADEERYFGHFSADAVFLGTDATERWTVDEFRAYAHPHFEAGRGWTYRATERHLRVSPDGRVAWFDERLHNDKYGEVRGSGVLVRDDRWRVAHYNLSFPIPNEIAGKVISMIQQDKPASSPQLHQYFVGFLRRGPAWTAERTEETLALGRAHMANIERLLAEGTLVVAGPFDHPEDAAATGPLAGLFILKTDTIEEAQAAMASDPAVKAGRFTWGVLPWWGPTGLTYDGAP